MPEDRYIVDLEDPTFQLSLQSVPESLTITATPKFEEVEIPCRSDPKFLWYTARQSMQFPIEYIICQGEEEERNPAVKNALLWLLSLKFGQRIKIVFGDMFVDDIWVVTGISSTTSLFQASKGYLPRRTQVTLSLALDPELSQVPDDFRNF